MKANNPFRTYCTNLVQTNEIKSSLENHNKIQLSGLVGSSYSLTTSAVIKNSKRPNLFIFQDKESASYFLDDLENLIKNEILFYPASNRRLYQIDEAENSNVILRSEVLSKLNIENNPIIVTYSEALLEKVISKKDLKKNTIDIQKNDEIEIGELENNLQNLNFEKVDFVIEPGQYSIRGGILDVYSYADEYPIRLEFYDTIIESIRSFDVNNQLSISEKDKIVIIPNTENKKNDSTKVSFLNYLPSNTIIWIKDVAYTKELLDDYLNKSKEQFKNNKIKQDPEELFTNGEYFVNELSNFSVIESSSVTFFDTQKNISINTSNLTVINKRFDFLKKDLIKNKEIGIQNIILCSSEEQEARFKKIFDNYTEDIEYRCVIFPLYKGYIDYTNKYAIYTDHQIFDRHYKFKLKTKFNNKQAITIKQLTELKVGDYITHIDHGIGKFEGLFKINNNSKKQEVIKLTYKDGDILYIGIHSLHKIAKFSSKEGVKPKINQLGSPAWKRTKEKTKQKVKKIAFDLINLYAKRKIKKGFAFSPDSYLQHELEASFIYEETPDQIKTSNEIKIDMEKEMPMDRLVCGDVGFGKTEIAIRAAFKAIADSKQVAVLVPTTILALQHYKTFKKRLKNLPCNVDYINRFKTSKEQKETIENLSKGRIDILIGTHRIVSKDVKFYDLGLLIVDEEQKFGVNIKDKIKLIKESIDTLTLSATPIPRTLQFSLLGARDLSIINTPPPNRQSVETNITVMNQELIRNAINYEISRNGQVYFIHNRIENIKEISGIIQKLCPNAKIKFGHGQMDGKKLEELMIDFIEGDFDVLVSTTIIENGVDVPNANTIIINNAQNFGLSDLHQMRGRVGRSNKKAFCYLISPPLHTISQESKKRLTALEQFSALGSGFKIAMRDLDIRGAGDLLGADQSGFINEIGFETYQKILDEAIEELKKEKFNELFKDDKNQFYIQDCQLETDLEILIPENYVSNVSERLNLYKEINNLKTEIEINNFILKIKDRFGSIPKNIMSMFDAIRMRWLSKEIGFERIVIKKGVMRAYLPISKNTLYYNSFQFKKVLDFLKNYSKSCEMNEKNERLSLKLNNINSIESALNICKNILSS